MGINNLDILKNQAKSVIKRQASRGKADIRRETSLVRELSRLSRKAGERVDDSLNEARGRLKNRAPGTLSGEVPQDAVHNAAARNSVPIVLADGYKRRSPVQPLYVPPDYRRRIIRKVAAVIAAAVILAVAVWLVWRYLL